MSGSRWSGVRRLTAAAAGAVAVLEARGPEARSALASLAGGRLPAPGRLRLASLAVGGELLDEVLLVHRDPDRVEVHLHGGPAVVARVAEELGGFEPGPDALAAGVLGLGARAAALLPDAPSEDGARVLLDQAQGALEEALWGLVGRPAGEACPALEALVERGHLARPLLRAPRVVLAGPTNAGKSTLFNVLVGSERVLTSDVPGTTRDAVVERAALGRLGVDLIDTAGERQIDSDGVNRAGSIEAAGQALGARLRAGADVVLWLSDGGPEPPRDPPVARARLVRRPGARRAVPERGEVAPLEDPDGTRALVAALVAAALPHEPWSAGRAVPYEPGLIDALERLARTADGGRRDGGLRRLLAPEGRAD